MAAILDDLGRKIEMAGAARRVVSLVPSLTELVFDLGAGSTVVGATRFCVEPAAELASVARVGGTKNPAIDRIVALTPDLVILNTEENRREDFDALAAAGLAIFVSDTKKVADIPGLISNLGKLLDRDEAAARLVDELDAARRVAAARARSPRRVFCPIWKNPWMGFNRDTYAHDILEAAGGTNLLADAEPRYCPAELSAIARLDPEAILLPDEPYVFRRRDLGAMAELKETTAWRSGRVRFIDGKALLWYGARTARALRYLADCLG